uniref:Plasmodium vivax Vir protein n=1 Tax=Parastrongyloides trichosuri TaxID=131310 RepID=A0A0N4ZQS0_PARTI
MPTNEYFSVICGLDYKSMNVNSFERESFMCSTTSDYYSAQESMPVECNLPDKKTYHCYYKYFEKKENCTSLPERCETVHLSCLNHSSITHPPIVRKTTLTTDFEILPMTRPISKIELLYREKEIEDTTSMTHEITKKSDTIEDFISKNQNTVSKIMTHPTSITLSTKKNYNNTVKKGRLEYKNKIFIIGMYLGAIILSICLYLFCRHRHIKSATISNRVVEDIPLNYVSLSNSSCEESV